MTKIEFRVSDMHCVNCAMKLQGLEDDLPGVLSVDASYQKLKMVVIFDEKITNETQIITAVNRLGYSANIITNGAINL